ncbi:MAG: hypothetical protein JEZ12_21545 [Desulfobacterium sp.]|nr:hypothetical protein [Desulfobacterium sp.]
MSEQMIQNLYTLGYGLLVLISVGMGFLMGRQTQDRPVKILKPKKKAKKIKAQEFNLR